jgi:hypothetical protein
MPSAKNKAPSNRSPLFPDHWKHFLESRLADGEPFVAHAKVSDDSGSGAVVHRRRTKQDLISVLFLSPLLDVRGLPRIERTEQRDPINRISAAPLWAHQTPCL